MDLKRISRKNNWKIQEHNSLKPRCGIYDYTHVKAFNIRAGLGYR